MRLITKAASAETSIDVRLLERLRANNITNTIEGLETRLDGSIGELGIYLKDIPKNKRDPQDIKSLQMAKSYREKYPRTNIDYPEIDQMTSNAFLLVSDQTN